MKNEIDRAQERTILISAEHFSTRFSGYQIEALYDDFKDYDCRVVLVLRDHMSRFCSGYTTHVTSGGRMTLEAFADEVLLPGNIYLRYEDLIDPWEMIFGDGKVELMVYGPDGISDFLSSLSVEMTSVPDPASYRVHVSPSPDVTAAIRLFNVAWDSRSDTTSERSWRRAAHLRKKIRARLQASAVGHAPRGWEVDRSRLSQLEEIARGDVAWLQAAYGIALPISAVLSAGRADPSAETELLAKALIAQAERSWNPALLGSDALALLVPLYERLRSVTDAVRRVRRTRAAKG